MSAQCLDCNSYAINPSKQSRAEHELPDKAVGYLVRKGLLKGPFRNETQGASK
jgi:hypothetical protein